MSGETSRARISMTNHEAERAFVRGFLAAVGMELAGVVLGAAAWLLWGWL